MISAAIILFNDTEIYHDNTKSDSRLNSRKNILMLLQLKLFSKSILHLLLFSNILKCFILPTTQMHNLY